MYVAAAAILGTPPDAAADGATVAAWFADHPGQVRAFAWLLTLFAPVVAVYAALVRDRLPAPHRDVFFFGAITFMTETAVSSWIWAALSWHPVEPATARLLLDVASFWGPVLTGSTIAMLAPVVLVARRLELPRWLFVLGALALTEQTIETITVFGREGFIAPGGPMNLFLGAILTLAWSTSLGIVLARRPAYSRNGESALSAAV